MYENNRLYQSATCPGGLLYAVRPNQTLYAISRIFSVTVDEIIDANPGIMPTKLRTGQLICIPWVADRVCLRGRLRTIVQGESLYGIAREEGVPLNTLIEANHFLPDPSIVFAGEQICIPLIVQSACCLVLNPVTKTNNLYARGFSLIEPTISRVTVTAMDLPQAMELGNFDTYYASLVFREIERLIPLNQVPQQPFIWTGAQMIDVPPLGANIIVVFPINTATGNRGSDILRGMIINCRNT